MRRFPPTEWVMCSTCSGFVFRKRRTSEVVEVVKEAEKMRDLMKAVLRHGPLQEIEPAEATKKQWQDLQTRRRIMMETKRCPTCSGSLLEVCPTCCHSLLQKPGPDEEDKAMVADPGSKAGLKEKKKRSREEGSVDPGSKAGLKEKKKRSREEGSELMAVLPSQGGNQRKKIATEDEAMVADARSEQKSKRSREEGKTSSSGLKERKKAKNGGQWIKGGGEDGGQRIEGGGEDGGQRIRDGGQRIKGGGEDGGQRIEGGGQDRGHHQIDYGNRKTKMEIRRLLKKTVEILNQPPVKPQPKEEAKMEDSESAVRNRKTKMVTKRLDKKSIDILMNQPPPKPVIYNTLYVNQHMIDMITAHDEVDCVFLEYLQCHSFIKGYAEYQVEVTDDEDDDHKLV
ncbi:unnamed protein product [Miscanthus lutarioriparius]|uniref:Uncharacterized protein n=1 Tax=Miscanthus lutarioriparius TaxID=422564 RepID=A0A811SIA7_9POAL|nr:unnamed protein product [Miscanthus lutarioriparius]